MSTPEVLHPINPLEEVDLGGPDLDAARARADDFVHRAYFKEAVKVIDQLRQEIASMTFSKRYNSEKKRSLPIGENDLGHTLASRGVDEAEAKRTRLLHDLDDLGTEVATSIIKLQQIVMDIEASKRDYREE